MKRSLLLPLVFLVAAGCGDRVPSPQTAHDILTRHFQKYGKKYKESDFGKFSLEKVEIFEVRETQKNMAEVEAYATLSNGTAHMVRVTLQKKPFGWRSLAWENLGER